MTPIVMETHGNFIFVVDVNERTFEMNVKTPMKRSKERPRW